MRPSTVYILSTEHIARLKAYLCRDAAMLHASRLAREMDRAITVSLGETDGRGGWRVLEILATVQPIESTLN